MEFKKVAVLGGAGTMGSGIVQTIAQAGIEVLLFETNLEVAQKGKTKLYKVVQKLVDTGKVSVEDKQAMLDRIVLCDNYQAMADVDLVIEAVFENIQLKRDIFKQIDEIVKPEALLASNTSALSLTEIASATKRPDKVIGLHFFNPVPVMKLVELVMGLATSEETYAASVAFCEQLGKKVIRAKDTPGFLVNYLQIPLINGAVAAYETGLSSAEDIDKACVLGMNHPIGPLALLDLIGLDTALAVFNVMYEGTGDMRFWPCTIHKRLVQAGHLGRKTGKGFYTYN
ncbi:3-hydroxybutyryl-CoA dehydrogenase [Desulfosporosinus sp.]|uniref:3-hydroxyacyl-CoA dehydrogenase family protein n=1 Tax=Desulfosporosinus sp. TaxID=157907 RepID=UPI00232656E8|nr:3-hydroxybutyryl-CoA dehydrogenase [Desulfosporosinus sp.]MCO5388047.1 3-hydroxybutyryl-CoA dehydrogenase [Desulfosporosinus sp.]MDA8222172.1 3-hydroxybutyryl-CoA dehydrogenase [Desulfitobacterium hafniense]